MEKLSKYFNNSSSKSLKKSIVSDFIFQNNSICKMDNAISIQIPLNASLLSIKFYKNLNFSLTCINSNTFFKYNYLIRNRVACIFDNVVPFVLAHYANSFKSRLLKIHA